MIIALQAGILIALCVMALIATVNVFTVKSISRSRKPRSFPMVSVLIPARNEERTIGQCLQSLLDQDYHNYEVLVLDDNSDDRTAIIIKEMASSASRVRYLQGDPLPSGWIGKNFACHQLSLEARGELLLFTDADTVHSRGSISSAVAELQHRHAHLLTVIPNQVMKTFWEKAVLPLLHFSVFCFLPFPLVRHLRSPRFAMANGQYMVFTRKAYEAIGGHLTVRDVIVEDVWLSRRIKEKGLGLLIMDGGTVVSCRMYSSFEALWHGFSKNLFAGFKFSLPVISAVACFNILTSVVPFVLLGISLAGFASEINLPIVVAQVCIILAIRLVLSLRFSLSYIPILLHPVAMLIVISIAVNSVRWVVFAGGAEWKGRKYSFRNQVLKTHRSTS